MMMEAATLRMLRVVAIALAVLFALYVAGEVFKPLVLATLLAFLLVPVVRWLEVRRVPRVLAVGLVLLVLAIGVGGTAFVVGNEFGSLAKHLPEYEANLKTKIDGMKLRPGSVLERAAKSITNLEDSLKDSDKESATPVRVVAESDFLSRIRTILGPFEVILTYSGIVLLLLVFMLIERDDINDRIVQLVGWRNIGVTTKTLNLIGDRLGRYLLSLALVNAGFGVAVMLGLWAIGLPYPAIWGLLAGLFRFVPYVGSLVAMSLPTVVSIVHFPGWMQPVLVVALFVGVEAVVNAIEPLIYGKTTGLSPTGLLVAALFWTWMWGGLGLLLANAMTVCLAVIGESVPSLGFMGTLLRHSVKVEPDLRWYQRVLSRDQEAALGLLDEALESTSFEQVCDNIIIPALTRAEVDRQKSYIESSDIRYLYRTVREWIDDVSSRGERVRLESATPTPLDATAQKAAGEGAPELVSGTVVGLASDGGEALILRMLKVSLGAHDVRIKVISASGSPLRVSDRIHALDPALILVSHLPSQELSHVCYFVRRLRARFEELPLLVGYWNTRADLARLTDQLRSVSARHVVLNLSGARSFILQRLRPEATQAVAAERSGMESALTASR